MQDRSSIKNKLRQVIYRHLQYLLRQSLRKRPQTCAFNRSRVVQPGLEIRLCQCEGVSQSPHDQVCDIRLGGVVKAKDCPYWKPFKNGQTLREEFQARLDTLIRASDRGPLAAEYPDVAALLWVLGAPDDDLWEGIPEGVLEESE